MREELLARIGDLMPYCEIEQHHPRGPVEAPAEGALYEAMAAAIRAHDPDGIPVPVMAPFATDAKHLARIGVPAYGFSPLGLEPGERFLDRFHTVDERVGLDAAALGPPRPVRRGRRLLRLNARREPPQPATASSSSPGPGSSVTRSLHFGQRKIRRRPQRALRVVVGRVVRPALLDHLRPAAVGVAMLDAVLQVERPLVHRASSWRRKVSGRLCASPNRAMWPVGNACSAAPLRSPRARAARGG